MAQTAYFDGNWIDIGSITGAVIYTWWHHRRSGSDRRLICTSTGVNFANGTALFPLLVLSCSVVSSWAMQQLLSANKLTLTVAGVISLLAVLEQ